MQELPEVFRELLGEGRAGQAYAFYGQVLDILAEGEGTENVIRKGTEGGAEQAVCSSIPSSRSISPSACHCFCVSTGVSGAALRTHPGAEYASA